jgi:predicted HTH domain antitoxin
MEIPGYYLVFQVAVVLFWPSVHIMFAFVNICKPGVERGVKMGTIATRVDKNVERFISDIMKTEGLDKSSTIRKLLEKGISQWKLERAIDALRSGKATLSKAAEMAGISLYEMVDIVREKKVDYVHISNADLEEDVLLLEGD